jgi:glutathione S-transferase
MKLRHSSFSPFVRKVRICAHEFGMKIDLVETNPGTDASLRPLNPLSKVPTLILDDGSTLYDSPVICEYLADLAGNKTMFPGTGKARWAALRDQALGDGIADASVALRGIRLLADQTPFAAFAERHIKAINAGLDVLEADCKRLEGRMDIGVVAIACAIAHVEIRHADLNWAGARPKLSAWYAAFNARPAMSSTKPG